MHRHQLFKQNFKRKPLALVSPLGGSLFQLLLQLLLLQLLLLQLLLLQLRVLLKLPPPGGANFIFRQRYDAVEALYNVVIAL